MSSSTFTSLAHMPRLYTPAKLRWRALAALFDSLAVLTLLLVFTLPGWLWLNDTQPQALAQPGARLWLGAIITVVGLLLLVGYYALFEALWHGQTPGKRLAELRVIHRNGQLLTTEAALTRNLLRPIDLLPVPYLLGGVIALANSQRRRLGDLLADTVVVYEQDSFLIRSSTRPARDPQSIVRRLALPPISPEVAALPLHRLRPDTLQLAEAYLRRRGELTNPDLLSRRILATAYSDLREFPPLELDTPGVEHHLSELVHAAILHQQQPTLAPPAPAQSTPRQP